jgi:hypothetical protein
LIKDAANYDGKDGVRKDGRDYRDIVVAKTEKPSLNADENLLADRD